jgi:hypothetical protein
MQVNISELHYALKARYLKGVEFEKGIQKMYKLSCDGT